MGEAVEVFVGCGNVFRDLCRPNAEELFLKARLSTEIIVVIKAKRLSRQRAADKMGISKERLIALLDGSPFDHSIDQLVNYLGSLGQEVNIYVSVTEGPPDGKKRLNGPRRKETRTREEAEVVAAD